MAKPSWRELIHTNFRYRQRQYNYAPSDDQIEELVTQVLERSAVRELWTFSEDKCLAIDAIEAETSKAEYQHGLL